ncbi:MULTISPECIES: ABC transporter substrate-binding protein [Ramlibacter]|uniref:ABC transporter substrate-binding protein n=1 Tax=Ramlibacter aquaticus TaxID=2780094 RepID=A0ABR9S9L5_9BURK|nr:MULTISPECIES: ABC transporter substrate-binding protein [Ramlibacter]MBE7939026.1 ABC transporter substrate-binding protein [Ramlibacter aquaticus]
MPRNRPLRAACHALLLCGALHLLPAEAEIVLAHVGPLSGPVGPNGRANSAGSQACVGEANASGGVNGQKLRLVREDDHYQPADTVLALRAVAAREHPVAFLNFLGSANMQAVFKDGTLDAIRIPVVGITPGSDRLRHPWIFHTQASDTAQLRRILTHLHTVGMERLGVVYQQIPFGEDGLRLIEEIAAELKLRVVARVAVPSAANDLRAQAAQLRASRAQAYVLVLVSNSGISFVRDVRGGGDPTPIYSMSYVEVQRMVDVVGARTANGVALAQVTPNPFTGNTGLVRQFHAAMTRFAPNEAVQSQQHLIGYLNCRTVVEGLQRISGPATPARLQAALRALRVDLGGYLLDFQGGNQGGRYVDLGVVRADGRLLY